jgi:hypothetical protein
MKREVHAAALRATSKVVFSVAFIAGCSNGDEAEETKPVQEAQVKSNTEAGACEGKYSCEDIVKDAFPTPGRYPGQAATTTNLVKQCCTELLVSKRGMIENRWDCCANHSEPSEADKETLWMACTPWGPPVPPAMRRARREEPLPLGVA